MTIVLYQTSSLQIWKRSLHLPNILLHCLSCHRKCRGTPKWTEFFLWKFLVFLGKLFHSVGSPLIPSQSLQFFRNCDPSYPVLPRFVGLRMLMDPSKTQHRIWKDVDFRALKIDDSFVTNQWQIFLWVFFPKNQIHFEDLILFPHQFCWYVEHFLQCEIWCIHDGILIVLQILTHECRCIDRHSQKHSPNYRMFFSFVCNVAHSFLSFSHLIIHSIHEFCCITSHGETFGGHFLRVDITSLPRRVTKWFSVPYGLRTSVEKSCFVMRTCCNILQEALSECPDWSCVVASAFHSWEDQTRS